jgi:uncharacterized membrane protein
MPELAGEWKVSHPFRHRKTKPGSREAKLHLKIRTKDLALIAIYAALYASLVVVLEGSSYGPIQVRIADSMIAIIPLIGMPGVLGHTFGVFLANIFSPAGLLDLLNTIPSFVMSFVIYYVYKRTENDYSVIGTCIAYSTVLGATVGWMLNYLYGNPLLLTIAYVALGNVIASVLIGWPVFKLLKRTGLFQGSL